ncbi:MAG: hypothetical protein M3297_11660 [Thermoproteota archaeon]|nr:hypothetical protein [Thermoproteota archaeon]
MSITKSIKRSTIYELIKVRGQQESSRLSVVVDKTGRGTADSIQWAVLVDNPRKKS